MVQIGTSGFSYADWVGPFYPKGLAKHEFLAYYSRYFQTCELNFSYYRMPTAQMLERMLQHSGGKVEFVVKAHQEMTHHREAAREPFDAFRAALIPFVEQERLGCVLAQFPYSFRNAPENVEYLKRFRALMEDLPLVIEFRNRAWCQEATFALLTQLDCGFCCVDEPALKGLFPPVAVATSRIGYVRFHGRNQHTWWQHATPAERYDYMYSDAELQPWMPKIHTLEKMTDQVYVFMNNHPHGQAVKNALRLKELFKQSEG